MKAWEDQQQRALPPEKVAAWIEDVVKHTKFQLVDQARYSTVKLIQSI